MRYEFHIKEESTETLIDFGIFFFKDTSRQYSVRSSAIIGITCRNAQLVTVFFFIFYQFVQQYYNLAGCIFSNTLSRILAGEIMSHAPALEQINSSPVILSRARYYRARSNFLVTGIFTLRMVVYRVRAYSLKTGIFTSHPVEYTVLSRCSRVPSDICLRLV